MSVTPIPQNAAADPASVARGHLRLGWWTLLVFLSMGLVLEALHGFKIGAYVNVSNETRRLMWTLAHAHGTLLGLVNIGFSFTITHAPEWQASSRRIASACLRGSTLLLPAGFFLGGFFTHGGDPGIGILLVPVGGVLLLMAVLLCALGVQAFKPGGKRRGR